MENIKRFNLDFRGVLASTKILPPILDDEPVPPFVRVLNLKHFVIPKAAEIVDEFKFISRPKDPTNSIITLKDFGTYKIVKRDRSDCLHIYFGVQQTLSFEIVFNYGKRNQKVARFLRGEEEVIYSDYKFLTETLPFDFKGNKDATWFNVVIASYQLVSNSIAILTLLYTLYNLNDDIQVEGGKGHNQEASEYIRRLSSRIRDIGSDFFEALWNLQAMGMFMW